MGRKRHGEAAAHISKRGCRLSAVPQETENRPGNLPDHQPVAHASHTPLALPLPVAMAQSAGAPMSLHVSARELQSTMGVSWDR